MTLEEYNALKSEIDALKRKESQAEGAVAQIKKGLREGFGTKSVADAKAMLARMEKEAKTKERELERAVGEWREKWGGKVDERENGNSGSSSPLRG